MRLQYRDILSRCFGGRLDRYRGDGGSGHLHHDKWSLYSRYFLIIYRYVVIVDLSLDYFYTFYQISSKYLFLFKLILQPYLIL